ncbi:MAG: dihydroneopterin aldolase [Spirochaetales bacterium]|nr:dihydroneopterin aldolase [Spirochaetales bacterium]
MDYDRIYIRDLHLRTIIGINPDERKNKQDIHLNITLFTDTKTAAESDNISDTANYKEIKQNIIRLVESSSYNLLETLAEETARVCLQSPHVKKTTVCIDKPGALRFAKSVAVEITRPR